MYICICKAITESVAIEASKKTTLDDFEKETGICCGCGKCRDEVQEIFGESLDKDLKVL